MDITFRAAKGIAPSGFTIIDARIGKYNAIIELYHQKGENTKEAQNRRLNELREENRKAKK